MKLEKYGKLTDKITERIHPLEKAHEFCFRRLDSLLDYILVQNPEIYYTYINALEKRWKTLVKSEHFSSTLENVRELIIGYPTIRNQLTLMKMHLSLFIEILGINENDFWKNEIVEVDLCDFTESANIPEYNWVDVLAEILGKEEAIRMFKGAIERYCVKYDTSTISTFESLDEMREAYIEFWESGRLGRIRIASNVENGVFIMRCENCEKIALLRNLERYDREILEAITCHSDFQVCRLYNENFVLTRTKTIGAGDPYCDFVYHDIRHDKKLEHPPKDYIDAMGEAE